MGSFESTLYSPSYLPEGYSYQYSLAHSKEGDDAPYGPGNYIKTYYGIMRYASNGSAYTDNFTIEQGDAPNNAQGILPACQTFKCKSLNTGQMKDVLCRTDGTPLCSVKSGGTYITVNANETDLSLDEILKVIGSLKSINNPGAE